MLHVWLYTDLLQALNGESLSAVFSIDGTLIPASTTPHCRADIKWLCASCDRCQTEDGIQWENKEGTPQESAVDQHSILRGGNWLCGSDFGSNFSSIRGWEQVYMWQGNQRQTSNHKSLFLLNFNSVKILQKETNTICLIFCRTHQSLQKSKQYSQFWNANWETQ